MAPRAIAKVSGGVRAYLQFENGMKHREIRGNIGSEIFPKSKPAAPRFSSSSHLRWNHQIRDSNHKFVSCLSPAKGQARLQMRQRNFQ